MKLNPLTYMKHIILMILIVIFSGILLWNVYSYNVKEGLTMSSVYTPEQLAEIREISKIAYDNVQKDTEKRLRAELRECKRKNDVAGTIQGAFASLTKGSGKKSKKGKKGKKSKKKSSYTSSSSSYF